MCSKIWCDGESWKFVSSFKSWLNSWPFGTGASKKLPRKTKQKNFEDAETKQSPALGLLRTISMPTHPFISFSFERVCRFTLDSHMHLNQNPLLEEQKKTVVRITCTNSHRRGLTFRCEDLFPDSRRGRVSSTSWPWGTGLQQATERTTTSLMFLPHHLLKKRQSHACLKTILSSHLS